MFTSRRQRTDPGQGSNLDHSIPCPTYFNHYKFVATLPTKHAFANTEIGTTFPEVHVDNAFLKISNTKKIACLLVLEGGGGG